MVSVYVLLETFDNNTLGQLGYIYCKALLKQKIDVTGCTVYSNPSPIIHDNCRLLSKSYVLLLKLLFHFLYNISPLWISLVRVHSVCFKDKKVSSAFVITCMQHM